MYDTTIFEEMKRDSPGKLKRQLIVNGQDSEGSDVRSGVPQGSVLGPVLFLLYINDQPDVVDAGSSIYMLADDTKLYREEYVQMVRWLAHEFPSWQM